VALHDLLGRIAETYDQRLGFDSEAQQLLRTERRTDRGMPTGRATSGLGCG
jgi:hypothetical protein